jgi:hypothetical protein
MDQTVDTLTVEDVDAVLARVAGLGVDWRTSRFATYREELVAQRAADRAFIEAFRRDEGRQRLSFETGAQLLQLLLAATVWDRLDRHLLKRALETVFAGAALDPPDDDRPRNTLLELVAAANLADRFQVSLTANAEDVRLDHAVLGQGAVECKRPKGIDNILPNLSKIGAQLRAREKSGSRFGVAVIGGDRIARLASQAHEAPTIEIADTSMEELARILADRVLKDAWNVACDLLPAACYATVIVTGSILVREPLHIRPVCEVIDFHLARASVSADVHEAFRPKGGGPLSRFVVHERTETPSSPGNTINGDRAAVTALETDIVIRGEPGKAG